MTPRTRTPEVRKRDAGEKLRTHLRTIAGLWPDLLDELTNPTGATSGPKVDGTKDLSLKGGFDAAHVVKAVTHDAWYLASIIDRETNAADLPNPLNDLPASLEWIAQWRADWIVHHHDEWLREQLLRDWAANAKTVRAHAKPTRVRYLSLNVACPDNVDISPTGERTPCPGTLRAPLNPDNEDLGDLVCDTDPAHKVTAEEWMRAAHRVKYDPERVAKALRTRRTVRHGAT